MRLIKLEDLISSIVTNFPKDREQGYSIYFTKPGTTDLSGLLILQNELENEKNILYSFWRYTQICNYFNVCEIGDASINGGCGILLQ